jgi:S1-C subfamily serine protease
MFSRAKLEQLAKVLEGLPVLGCLPGGTAAEAGVRHGDILLAVNGIPTPTIAEFIRARATRADGYELALFRDGATLNLFVPFRVLSEPLASFAESIVAGRFVPANRVQPEALPSA